MAERWPRRTGLVAGLAVVLVIAGWGALAIGASGSTIWLDAPLDDAVVPLAKAVTVVGHVADEGPVNIVRLDVDGVTVAEANLDASPGQLTTVKFSWQPTVPGTHILTLWAGEVTGEWAGPATATITVVGEVTTTTLPAPTTTTTPPATTTTTPPATTTTAPPATTTTTPCTLDVPALVSPSENADVATANVPLTWSYDGCTSGDLQFHVQVSSEDDFSVLAASRAVATTNWDTPALPCGDYWWRVRVVTPDTGSWSTVRTFILDTGTCP